MRRNELQRWVAGWMSILFFQAACNDPPYEAAEAPNPTSSAAAASLSTVAPSPLPTAAQSGARAPRPGRPSRPGQPSRPQPDSSPTASPSPSGSLPPEVPTGSRAPQPPTQLPPQPPPPRDPFVDTLSHPSSTFGIDVDTASYTRIRASLVAGVLPSPKDVRTEELLNYFRYSYPAPKDAAFGFLVDAARAPWDAERRLVRIGIKGREVEAASRPPANLVLLIDASGSMAGPKKFGLLKDGFAELVEKLGEKDRVAIVAYAGRAGVVLPSTPGNQRAKIINALDSFEAGGATNGALGIQRGYEVAAESWIEGGINRVVLATDGDFNVGATQLEELKSLIGRKAKTGIFLTVLGFGSFNPNDKRMEALADKGNGHYAFIDGPSEARRVLVEELGSTLQTIAKDVKLQVHWDRAFVSSYRLLGYENRALAEEDFVDDSKDAGELGAGHTVTALYEIQPSKRSNDDVIFGTVALRYKDPDGSESRELEAAIIGSDLRFQEASTDFRFAASVAAFSLLLRGSPSGQGVTFNEVARWAEDARGDDAGGSRQEFVSLVRRAAQRLEVAKGARRPVGSKPKEPKPVQSIDPDWLWNVVIENGRHETSRRPSTKSPSLREPR